MGRRCWRFVVHDKRCCGKLAVGCLAGTSEVGDWQVPDFRLACAYAASQGWLLLATRFLCSIGQCALAVDSALSMRALDWSLAVLMGAVRSAPPITGVVLTLVAGSISGREQEKDDGDQRRESYRRLGSALAGAVSFPFGS